MRESVNRSNMENNESKISINVLEVLKDFLHKWWIILIASVLGASALIVYNFFTTEKEYTATAKMYVNNSSMASISDAIDNITSSGLQASRSLVSSYAAVLKTHRILEDVLKTANIKDEKGEQKYSYEDMEKMVSIGAVNSTEVCYISVTCASEDDAKLLANTTLHVFREQIGSIINGTSANVVDYAVDAVPVSRGFTKMGLIGFAVGFVLSLAVIFLVDFYVNDTFQNADGLKQSLPEDIPVLSIIPDTDSSHTGKYGYYKKYGHYSNDYSYSYYQETVESEEEGNKENE